MRWLIIATGVVFIFAGAFGLVSGSFEPSGPKPPAQASHQIAPAGTRAQGGAVTATPAGTGGRVVERSGTAVARQSEPTAIDGSAGDEAASPEPVLK